MMEHVQLHKQIRFSNIAPALLIRKLENDTFNSFFILFFCKYETTLVLMLKVSLRNAKIKNHKIEFREVAT